MQNASHKGTGDKPNVNMNGTIDEAADKSINPEDILHEGILPNTTKTQEFVDYPPQLNVREKK